MGTKLGTVKEGGDITDDELKKELRQLRRLAILNYVEIRNLKNRLYHHLKIEGQGPEVYQNSLHRYIEDLDERERILIKTLSYLADK